MVICLERDADLDMAQLMPLPLTVSCFSKIQIGFTFLVPAHPGSPGKRAIKRVCVCLAFIGKDQPSPCFTQFYTVLFVVFIDTSTDFIVGGGGTGIPMDLQCIADLSEFTVRSVRLTRCSMPLNLLYY